MGLLILQNQTQPSLDKMIMITAFKAKSSHWCFPSLSRGNSTFVWLTCSFTLRTITSKSHSKGKHGCCLNELMRSNKKWLLTWKWSTFWDSIKCTSHLKSSPYKIVMYLKIESSMFVKYWMVNLTWQVFQMDTCRHVWHCIDPFRFW